MKSKPESASRPRFGAAGAGVLRAAVALGIAVAPAIGQTAPPANDSLFISSNLPPPSVELPSTLTPDLAAPAVPDNYIVGANDLLSIFVYQMPELTAQTRVDSKGEVSLPLLATSIRAEGQTGPQIAASISSLLRSSGLAKAPQVRVLVRQVMSHPIVVAGAVTQPTVIEASRPMRLIEVVARAGGFTNLTGTSVLVSYPGLPTDATRSIEISKLIDSTDPADDPILYGGEVVRVLPARQVFVVGAVQKPGSFPVASDQPITVLRAIALAQGLSTTVPANATHAAILRNDGSGARKEIPLNLTKILEHGQEDPVLQPGDMLYVPESGKRKALNSGIAAMSQALVIALGYRVF